MKKALEEIRINEIIMNSAYHVIHFKNSFIKLIHFKSLKYKLVSFTERRETKWKHKPYCGPKIYRDSNGPVPGPWQIHIVPQTSFEKGKTKCEVPNSAYSKRCYRCYGFGKTRCTWCSGRGHVIKRFCSI